MKYYYEFNEEPFEQLPNKYQDSGIEWGYQTWDILVENKFIPQLENNHDHSNHLSAIFNLTLAIIYQEWLKEGNAISRSYPIEISSFHWHPIIVGNIAGMQEIPTYLKTPMTTQELEKQIKEVNYIVALSFKSPIHRLLKSSIGSNQSIHATLYDFTFESESNQAFNSKRALKYVKNRFEIKKGILEKFWG